MKDKKVLIVDDDLSVREIVRVALRAYEVIEGSNGIEALEKVTRENPDLIILDVMMPKMNGFEVIRCLKADRMTREIPILLLTARGDRNTLKQGEAAGVLTYITKPFSPRALAEKVAEIMKAT